MVLIIDMGWKLIFATDNSVDTKVRWTQKETSSGIKIQSSGGNAGICGSMVAKWVQKSISFGQRGIQSASELGSPHLMGIIHSAFWVQKSAFGAKPYSPMDNSIAMFQANNLLIKDYINGSCFLNLTAVFNRICLRSGYFALLFTYVRPNQRMIAGHAIGFRHDHEIFQMFDPVVGLIEYSDEKSFRKNGQLAFRKNKPYCYSLLYNKGHEWKLLELG